MNQRRETLRQAFSNASRKIPIVRIAEVTGIPKGSLYEFGSTGHLGEDRAETLRQWLVENGYMNAQATHMHEATAPYPAPKKPAFEIVASDLRVLADYLDSPEFTPNEKVERLAAFNGTLKSFQARLKDRNQHND